MNKSFFLSGITKFLFLYFIFSAPAAAQFGVKVGVSLSGLLSSRPDDFRQFLGYEVEWVQYGESKPVVGIQLGIFYTINLSDYFDFQPEINFVQRGYWFDQTSLYDTRYKIGINYLEFPLYIRYKVPVDFMNLNLTSGPYAAIKLNASSDIEYEGITKSRSPACVKDFDYGIAMAFGSEFSMGSGQMILDFMLNWGLSNILFQPDNFISLYDDPGKVRNLSLTLTTGYRFGNDGESR